MKYRVTVLMGIYNCASTLREALESLLWQTYQGFKVVICDDASTDGSAEIAQEYARCYDNFAFISNDKNLKLAATLNNCLRYADTEYVARMDGDDISLPMRFEKELAFLDEHPDYAVVSTPMIYFDEHGDFHHGKGQGEIRALNFVHGSPICHAPCMARTSAFLAVGGYTSDEYFQRVEDYHLWFKLYSKGYKIFVLDECLYKMRDDRAAQVRRNWAARKNEFWVKHVGYKMIGLPFYYQIFALTPLIKYFVPSCIYRYIHRKYNVHAP